MQVMQILQKMLFVFTTALNPYLKVFFSILSIYFIFKSIEIIVKIILELIRGKNGNF